MRSRLLRIGVLALAAFAVMPGTALALDSAADAKVAANSGTFEPCPSLCIDGPTGQPICVLKVSG